MTATAATRNPSFGEAVRALGRPRVALIFAQGFSSGLPFFLTAATLGFWLRDEGTSLKAIGFLSLVGLAYSFKFVWSPFIDRIKLPIFGRLGLRRGWMLLTQIAVGLGLLAMAVTGPKAGLTAIGVAALFVAFAAASQDIVIDAFRIEWASDTNELGMFTAVFQIGYRVAVLVSDAAILSMAKHFGWPISYVLMAVLMGVGIFATFKVSEPTQADAAVARRPALWTPAGFADGFGGPFVVFFKDYGWTAILMIALIMLYRLPEYVIGPMITPFYSDLHLDKDMIALVRTSVGLVASFVGIAAGGFVSLRYGYIWALIVGGIFQAFAEASFALLAAHHDSMWFAAVMCFDNFGISMAGVALVTYMSSLTRPGYTATQYAFLTSMFAMLGKVFKGFSGWIVESIQHSGHTLMESYSIFFICAGLIGTPAILLCFWLLAMKPKPQPSVSSAPSS
ncbi:MAG TPA: MFS transporter [Caulobacteraceae bacterium]|jgi:PAT family beta-lactamase induction signal transducer AmpG|nr:MFS transporter [Caulobacteraceae bacterium]